MQTPKKALLAVIYRKLRDDRMVESQADFSRKTKFSPTAMSQMIKGEKPVPLRLIKSLYKVFQVNANYVMSEGKETAFYLKDLPSAVGRGPGEKEKQKSIQKLTKENQELKMRLADKEKIIQLLERQKA